MKFSLFSSTTSLASTATTASTTSLASTATATSTTHLRPKAAPKDYSATFATFQSSYGFIGHAPAIPARTPAHPTPTRPASAHPAPTTSAPAQPAQKKDFEAAFATLSSSYGFGGTVPSVPKKKH